MHENWNHWLLRLGRLLPDRLRECVFEPACYDMVHDTLVRRGSLQLLTPRIVGILVHVTLVNFPRVLIEGRRPSRFALLLGGVAVIGLLALTSVVIMMRSRY